MVKRARALRSLRQDLHSTSRSLFLRFLPSLSFLDTTAADVSDTQEQVALTRPLKSPTRKFNTLFSCQRDVFFMMHKEFCNSDADLFGGFAGRHNYSQSLFF
jgi:hypothetical protein